LRNGPGVSGRSRTAGDDPELAEHPQERVGDPVGAYPTPDEVVRVRTVTQRRNPEVAGVAVVVAYVTVDTVTVPTVQQLPYLGVHVLTVGGVEVGGVGLRTAQGCPLVQLAAHGVDLGQTHRDGYRQESLRRPLAVQQQFGDAFEHVQGLVFGPLGQGYARPGVGQAWPVGHLQGVQEQDHPVGAVQVTQVRGHALGAVQVLTGGVQERQERVPGRRRPNRLRRWAVNRNTSGSRTTRVRWVPRKVRASLYSRASCSTL